MPKGISKKNDISGRRFGRLTAIRMSEVPHRPGGCRYWEYRCDCGKKVIKKRSDVMTGDTLSCGCLRAETTRVLGKRQTTHGLSCTQVWRSWRSMRKRCRRHPRYLGRITICKRWDSFENFFKDMGHPKSKDLTLDRIDNLKGYSKKNCRWATYSQQNNNRADTRILEYKNQKMSASQWARKLDIPVGTVHTRPRKRLPLNLVLSKKNLPK